MTNARWSLRPLRVWRALACAFAVVLLALCGVRAGAATPDEFAEGLVLLPTGDAPLQRVELPLGVYAGTVRADLGDMRVFAPDGSEVPYALVARGAPRQDAAASFSPLPLFPLPAAALSGSGLEVRVDGGGAIVSVQGAPADGDAAARVYLVDTGNAGLPVRELELRFAGDGDVLGAVDVDAGDTLQSCAPAQRRQQPAAAAHSAAGSACALPAAHGAPAARCAGTAGGPDGRAGAQERGARAGAQADGLARRHR